MSRDRGGAMTCFPEKLSSAILIEGKKWFSMKTKRQVLFQRGYNLLIKIIFEIAARFILSNNV